MSIVSAFGLPSPVHLAMIPFDSIQVFKYSLWSNSIGGSARAILFIVIIFNFNDKSISNALVVGSRTHTISDSN